MRQSKFSIRTLKEAPKDEIAANAKLLARAGFIQKIGAGIYAYLPLGLRVINNIEKIVREEMNAVGGQELLLPALHPKEYWQTTGRWEGFDALYKITAREEREYGLGPTHEEIVAPLAKTLVQSYKDLPLYLYQIQTKFRDEPRAKSGLLRGREFIMKDLYSFHANEKDLTTYYEKIAKTYEVIFKRCDLQTIRTKASGGTFSKFSDEYQVVTPAGEDTIFICNTCKLAWNLEIIENKHACPNGGHPLTQATAAEVGNIFKLGTTYSIPFGLSFQDEQGKKREVIMGCYGIGISRVMGVVSEIHQDAKGLIWPKQLAPFLVHLLKFSVANKKLEHQQDAIYEQFLKEGIEVLYDDRSDVSEGAKLAQADLIGLPWRVIVSSRTLKEGKIEIKQRAKTESSLVTVKEFISILRKAN